MNSLLEQIVKTDNAICDKVQEMKQQLLEFVKAKGGFIYFDIDENKKYPECPIVRIVKLQEFPSRYRTEPAYEHLVYALMADEMDDILIFTDVFMETYTEVYSKEEILNSTDGDDHWHSLFFGDDVIYYDTLQRICNFLIDNYDDED